MSEGKELAEILEFEGQCRIEHGGWGHWTVPVTFKLKTNKARTKWWYEASCAPGKPQPRHGLYWRAEILERLEKWPETLEVLQAFGAAPAMMQEALRARS